MNTIIGKFCKIVSEVTNDSGNDVGIHAPTFDQSDEASVSEVVKNGWVSYQGIAVKEFENDLSNYLNMPHVIATVNGTAALFIALKASGIAANDEVLIPSLSFVATANVVVHANAFPHFVDVDKKTFAIDWHKLEDYLCEQTYYDDSGQLINKQTNRRIKGIIPVHILGASFDIQQAIRIAKKYNLILIEDSAEALGSQYGLERVSGLSGIGVLSFNGNKIITTGGGGAVIVRDEVLGQKIRHLITTAKVPHPFEFMHDDIGYNLRLPALNAALGISQLKKIGKFLILKQKLNQVYKLAFSDCSFGKMFDQDLYGQSNCWLNAFILKCKYKNVKNKILEHLHRKKIGARPLWKPLNILSIYDQYPSSDCSVARQLYDNVICLPSSPSLVKHA